MIPAALSTHLWQSTILGLVAGALVLILGGCHARVRYWLWMAASVKFLVPFSLLIAIGNRWAILSGSGAGAKVKLHFAIAVISGPAPASVFPGLMQLVPLLSALWLCGSLLVLSLWRVQWRKMLGAKRDARRLDKGREREALRRVERSLGMQRPIEILLSRASMEPGVFGIIRPVLLWPEGISGRLDDAHLEAILAHEVRHVRRRDNLAAAIHMLVESVFWFHPLVWWVGTRLLEERERACDEEVLESGRDRHVYAESILKVCQFCLASPIACLSGVAGGNLKKRMEHIMAERTLQKLDLGKKLLLGAVGLAAIAVPVTFGLVTATGSRAGAPAAKSPLPSDAAAPVQVSQEVMSRQILKKVPPEYPEAAKRDHIQGVVVLDATIGKTGDVENLRIVSGHPQLVPAAIEGVKQWKYRPYLVNGQPVDVETEIDVHFTLAD
jgi:bla regulator protein BlaR1